MNGRWKLGLVLVIAAMMAALVIAHVHDLNGPWYWKWPWRRLGWGIYPLMLAAASPIVAAQWLFARRNVAAARLVPLLMLGTLLAQIAAMSQQPLGLGRVKAIVENSVNTSYYNAAKVLTEQMDRGGKSYRDWLEIYPDLMDKLMLHAGYKPPGLIFYYIAMIRLFGPGAASAWAGGMGLALLACASVAATYFFLRHFNGGDETSAFLGASYFALCPSLILFLPQFDQAYPVLSCGLLMSWSLALRRRWMAPTFGALLALATFLSPTFLMFGLFLVIYTLIYIADASAGGARGGAGAALVRAIERSVLALATLALLYFLLYYATGFDPITTFKVAADRSQAHLVSLQRPWPLHLFFDVADIAMGIGWIAVPLIVLGVWHAWRQPDRWHSPAARLIFLGLIQVLMAIAVAVFPGENARLMLPLMPLLMPPIGVELSRWLLAARIVIFILLALLVAVICHNTIFLYMGPEIEGVPRIS